MNAIVMDEAALSIVDAAIIDDTWFESFRLPSDADNIRMIKFGDTVYLLSSNADVDSVLIVLNNGPAGVFNGNSDKRSVLERAIRVGLRHIDRSVTLPTSWYRYHTGALISVFSDDLRGQGRERIVFHQSPDGTEHLYGFALTDDVTDLEEIDLSIEIFKKAIDGYLEALASDSPSASEEVGNYGILLSAPLGRQLATSGSLDEWLNRKLNKQQTNFVNKNYEGPIRLRGAAGTGKTQAMAVKCLKDIYSDADSGGDKTFAFLTHSSQLAHEVVKGMFYTMDMSNRWNELKTQRDQPKIWIGTIYELAQEKLNYLNKGLQPLDTDGRVGHEFQHILLDTAISEVEGDPRLALGVLNECEDIKRRLITDENRSALIFDLMNEFACVLDAENIRIGTPAAEVYLSAKREDWQLELATTAHRKLVLEIYEKYREILAKEGMLSLDQMIADFDKYLQSHEWGQLREVQGFDVIFVDEYHFMNRIETMTLQHLFKTRARQEGKWPLVMAYDLKQSTSDASLGGGIDRFKNPGVGVSQPIDLVEVYRSTPEITAFLADIDASFPAMDLEGEYRTYDAVSSKEAGDKPILLEFDDNIQLIDDILDRALKLARKSSNKGRDVAVLCLNEQLFDQYRKAGRNQKKIVPIISRSDLRHLRYAKNKCVFSMPEYVAGLQFESVFLIHADKAELSGDYVNHGTRRRFVTRAYLGTSRATERVYVASSRERGGPSKILEGPLKAKSLVTLSPN